MLNQRVKHRKGEKKISLEKAKKRENKRKKDNIFDKMPNIIELMIPDCVDEKRDYIVLGDNKYSRNFVISTYPNKIFLGWLDRIFSLLGDVSLSIMVRPTDQDTVVRQLNKKVTILESEKQTYENKGTIDLIHPIQKMIYDYDEIRNLVQTYNDKLFFVSIFFRINATNLEELNTKSNLLKSEFAKLSAKARCLNFRQFEGLRANLPFDTSNIIDYERNVTSEGLATMFPIANSNTESNVNGVPIGRNYFTGLPVYLNTFDKSLTNPHIVILGITGAGKSVTMDTLSSRSLVTRNTQSAILDIEGEYVKRTESLGGRIIKIKQGMSAGINLFDIDVEIDENGMEKVNILNKVAEIRAILSAIMRNYMDRSLNAKELVDIEESVIETYKEKGITTNKESIYEGMEVMYSPITILFAVIVIIAYSFFISGLCIAIASTSKTFKEAQSALTPLTFISFFPGMIAFMMGITTTPILSIVPFLNFTLIFTDINNGTINLLNIGLMAISTIIYISLVFAHIIKQYKSEKVLFAK